MNRYLEPEELRELKGNYWFSGNRRLTRSPEEAILEALMECRNGKIEYGCPPRILPYKEKIEFRIKDEGYVEVFDKELKPVGVAKVNASDLKHPVKIPCTRSQVHIVVYSHNQ